MQHLSLTLPTLPENLALDEALLLQAEAGAGGEVLRFWHWPQYAVVLGAGGVMADDVHVEACQGDGVPILRRASGGGTVLLGPECLIFSLVLNMEKQPELQHITSSYRFILGRIAEALHDLQPGIELAGTSDLAVAGRKFSGNSQQRKRRFLLHHGTILHALDLSRIGHYLKLPPRRPGYRGERGHDEFVMNLEAPVDEITARIQTIWQATEECTIWPAERVQQLLADRYERDDWHSRR